MSRDLQVVNFDETAMTPEVIQNQVNVIQHTMKQVMKDGEHFGKIPGCGDKPTLLKPGAEKICMTFRLAPTYQITKTELTGGHREYEIICSLIHIPTEQTIGEGVGLCSSMESKYRWRKAERECPQCGKQAIIKGQAQYGGGWLCWKKKDGCGAKFEEGDKSIEGQECGQIENPDIADTFNTVLKMAKKRAHVDAVLTATAASDLFTQDIEDMPNMNQEKKNEPPKQDTGKSTGTTTTQKKSYQKQKNNEPPPPTDPPNQEKQEKVGLDVMREKINSGYPSKPGFPNFLVKKKWLEEGQAIADLTDNQVERLYNNFDQIENLFNQYVAEQL